jgi:predicted Co/Zn/Cd cation transporter (cation efflux family)
MVVVWDALPLHAVTAGPNYVIGAAYEQLHACTDQAQQPGCCNGIATAGTCITVVLAGLCVVHGAASNSMLVVIHGAYDALLLALELYSC